MSDSISIPPKTSSFTGNIRTTLAKRTLLLRYLVIVNLIFGAWYLEWRIAHSLSWQFFWIAIPLLVAEIYAYIGSVMFLIGMWRPIVRQVKSLKYLSPPLAVRDFPTVDVFITCYNEPVEMVEQTARAALALDYPTTKLRVYILDDGNSPQMREMANKLCLEDLASPQLQQEVEKIRQQESQLVARLEQYKTIEPEVAKAEEFLESFQIEVKSEPESLAEVLDWFQKLRPQFVPQRVWLESETALAEALDNAIRYAHRALPATTAIQIQVIVLSQAIEIQIWDCGPSLDWEKLVRQKLSGVELTAENGRGIMIMNEISDRLSYTRMPDGRNCLWLIKYYSPLTELQTENQPSTLIAYLQSFRRLILLLHPNNHKLDEYFRQEQKALEREIKQTKWCLQDLPRCRYIARPKPEGKPHHAKAGNINYAVFSGSTTGDFIITLDADHIPKPEFIQRVLPYFFTYNINTGKYDSNQIAFVQTPQTFYNLPSNDPFGHQAHLFYGPIQQSKDGMNAAFYTGTNAMLRREALVSAGLKNFTQEFIKNPEKLTEFELVGGVSSNSITEDMNTAMRLHAAGWKSIYHGEELSEGLAPDDLGSTLQQRLRWAQGTIQVLQKENPFGKPGLTFWQQLHYFQTMYSYFSGFATLIFLICPIVYFFTGIIPVQAFGPAFAIHFIPTYILNRLTFIAVSWGVPFKEVWRSEQYAIALFPVFINSVISVFFGKSIKFKVTPKQRQSGNYLRLVLPQITIILLTLSGIIWSIYRAITGNMPDFSVDLINIAWSIYNLLLLSVIVQAAIWQPKSTL